MDTVISDYEVATGKVYSRQSYADTTGAIAAAILVLAEAIRYHADVTAPILPEKSTGEMDGSQNAE